MGIFFSLHYSALLRLPLLRIHCVEGCCDVLLFLFIPLMSLFTTRPLCVTIVLGAFSNPTCYSCPAMFLTVHPESWFSLSPVILNYKSGSGRSFNYRSGSYLDIFVAFEKIILSIGTKYYHITLTLIKSRIFFWSAFNFDKIVLILINNSASLSGSRSHLIKGPKHDLVECGFFYTNQTRMVKRLGDWQKKLISFMIGANIRHFVFLANAEHTLKIM